MKKLILFVFIMFTSIINAQVANQPSDFEVCDNNNFTPGSPIDANDINDGLMCFDLSQKNPEVLGTQNPADFTITYHVSQTDADISMNALSIPFCNTSNPQTIYVRLESIITGDFDTTSFMLNVISSPSVPDSAAIDIFKCDEPNSIDGFTTFDLTVFESYIYGSQSTTDNTLRYFETEADAIADMNAITNLTSYTNTVIDQQIYIRMTNITTGCFTIGFFILFVEEPATLIQPTSLDACDFNNSEIAVFDLTTRALDITNGDTSIELQYYASAADLNNNTPIVNPTAYSNTDNPQTIFVRAITGDFDCPSDVTQTIRVLPAPSIPSSVTPILSCDDDNDGLIVVDLSSRETEIIDTNTDVVVSYHEQYSDAISGSNPISNPTNFSISTSNFSNSGITSVIARIESTLQVASDNTPCFSIVYLQVFNTNPLFTNTSYDYRTCVDDTSYVGTFNWDTITDELSFLNSPQIVGDFLISYHLTATDVITNNNPLANGFQNTTNPQTVYIRAENSITGCVETENIPTLTLDVQRTPIINENLTPIEKCDPNGNGIALFRIRNEVDSITDDESLNITYYETQEDAENAENEVNASFYYNTTPNIQTMHVRAENTNGCYSLTTLNLVVNSECLPFNNIIGSYICEYDTPGLGCFNLMSRESEVLGSIDPSDAIVSYHLSDEDAFYNTNAISNPATFCTTEVDNTIYVRVEEISTGNVSATVFTLVGLELQSNINTPTPLLVCDPENDGIAVFPLASKILEIFDENSGYGISYHATMADAEISINRLDLLYTNTTPYSQTIYARISGHPLFYPNAECYEIVPLELVTEPTLCNVSSNENYEVTTIPHAIYTIEAIPSGNIDDTFTYRIDIPFEFDFFGKTYNEFVIGTNGIVSFNESYSNAPFNWLMDVSRSIPSAELYTNSIFGVYHDLLNNGTGSLGYGVIGEAPFRKMVIFFDEINQFGDTCNDPSTTQIILYETLNVVDVQVEQKISCSDWNGGLGLLGIQDEYGLEGYFPEGRNTGAWDAIDEGHRFAPITTYENVFSILCDDGADGFLEFDLSTIDNDILGDITTGTVTYFNSEQDLLNNSNPLPTLYTNTRNSEIIYARVLNGTTNEATIKTVTLAVIDCNMDTDSDGVSTMDEDVNGDGNLGNDDTDGDGIPDFVDEDDDGDYVLTNVELLNTATITPQNGFLDTDDDGIPNHRDNDDDGDGTLTVDEDYNGNNNPEDDDTNNNNIPDYLDNTVFLLSVDEFETTSIRMYPNPAKDNLTVEAAASVRIQSVEIYSVDGQLVHAQKQAISTNSLTIDVSNFSSGFYVLRMKTQTNATITKQFIVE
ncbi:T9SS type A sorting domain-containing protein [Kordia sp.]|uniref:T9SS type A sorting domain-containing protein n=1 Tax=Kordia sp. TaxID=1965332 RepID=UPI003D2C0D0B